MYQVLPIHFRLLFACVKPESFTDHAKYEPWRLTGKIFRQMQKYRSNVAAWGQSSANPYHNLYHLYITDTINSWVPPFRVYTFVFLRDTGITKLWAPSVRGNHCAHIRRGLFVPLCSVTGWMRGSVSQYQDVWETPAGSGCTGLLCSAIKTWSGGGSFVRQGLFTATCLKCHKCQSLLVSEWY